MLLQIALKSTVVLAAGLAITSVMRRSSAAARHLVLASALLATLAMPAIVRFGPEWPLGVLPWSTASVNVPAVRHRPGVRETPAEPAAPRPTAENRRDWLSASQTALSKAPNLTSLLLLGAAIGLARLMAGFFWAVWVARRARPLSDWTWTQAARRIAQSLGIARPIALRVSTHTSIPLTWGLWSRSVLLLPVDAQDWPADRRRAVLLHEMSHIRRRDCLVRSLAHAACALQWFNPLAHLVLRRLRKEQEHACDDAVLAAGVAAPDYADHLLEIVRMSCATAMDRAALAMGRRSELEGRMFAILDHTRRRDASSRRTRLVAAAATAGAVVAIGAMQLSGAQNAALAPLAGGPQTGTSRMDGSLPEWTRSVDEETRRRVAAVLEAALRDGDEKVRETAQKALDAIGDPSRGTVVVSSPCRGNCIFGNPHISVALDIRAAIVEIETRLALVEMQRGGSEARKRSLALLVGRTESSAAALATLLQDRDPQIRTLAALHLDSVVYPPAIPGWIALLGDKDDSLRERAAISLGAIGDPSAIDELTLTLLNDQSPDVRRQAARSLGLIAAGGDRG